jgi:hypothetical protein
VLFLSPFSLVPSLFYGRDIWNVWVLVIPLFIRFVDTLKELCVWRHVTTEAMLTVAKRLLFCINKHENNLNISTNMSHFNLHLATLYAPFVLECSECGAGEGGGGTISDISM